LIALHDVAQDDDGRELIVLYVGDFDPSGMYMSEKDLPDRLSKYDGDHVELRRIALTRAQTRGLPSFPAADKSKDPFFRPLFPLFAKPSRLSKDSPSFRGSRCESPESIERQRNPPLYSFVTMKQCGGLRLPPSLSSYGGQVGSNPPYGPSSR
jgi:hypothetical protein